MLFLYPFSFVAFKGVVVAVAVAVAVVIGVGEYI
jgi:hypothetical protein